MVNCTNRTQQSKEYMTTSAYEKNKAEQLLP
nr:unnamed protein product [Callosobruchus chinensis]